MIKTQFIVICFVLYNTSVVSELSGGENMSVQLHFQCYFMLFTSFIIRRQVSSVCVMNIRTASVPGALTSAQTAEPNSFITARHLLLCVCFRC